MVKEKSSKKKILFFIVGLIALGASVFAGVYIGMNKFGGKTVEKSIEEAYFDLGEIFVNLNEKDNTRYVKLTVTISYDNGNKELKKEIENKKVPLRDVAIFYFKSLKASDFQTENELILKKNFIDKLNSGLKSGFILDAKFNELLIQ